ncbi:MAG TPA: phosphate-starvation-inducible PsiE family protein [Actinomadura sp.]|nr:phosphate-starvation-inducible PsiE family protein [Actinomadura sp.]
MLYGVVGLLLAAAAVFVLAGAVEAIVSAYSAHKNAAEISLLVLDRVLLALIVAELLYTLRFVVRTHEIVAEPFLFIGLIAVVRRILIVAGRFEQPEMGQVPTNLLLELGILGLLALALAASIFLIRLSGGKGD